MPQTSMDKLAAWEQYHFDAIFVGDDWKGKPNWIRYEQQLAEKGVDVVFFPYTQHTSSTRLRRALELLEEKQTD